MELRHLRYFVAVAEELSFRRAADRLNVSHPALSQQIQDLEDELGFKLFDRNSRQVELTEVGRVFPGGTQRAIQAAKQAVTLAQEAAKGERGRLIIGCIGPLVGSFLPNALVRFRQGRPLVEVTVSHMNAVPKSRPC
jgi:DNA-binding transcriptional LysR family regulator